MPLGFKHFTEPLTFRERAELKAENEAWRAMETRIAELERIIYLYCDPCAMPDNDAKIAQQVAEKMQR